VDEAPKRIGRHNADKPESQKNGEGGPEHTIIVL
jgi:hypothetical protein